MGNRVGWSKKFPMVLGAIIATSLGGIGGALAETTITDAQLATTAGEDSTSNTGPTGSRDGLKISFDAGRLPTQPGETKLTRMPAHTAFRGLADSKQYKEMFKGMITSEVPVMFQTMMMVENGAATGFIGSLQSVSNMLDSSIQAANLELAMRRVQGPEAEKQFVNAVHEGLVRSENDQVDHLWPVGLFYASGDQITEQLTTQYKLQQPYKRNNSHGATTVQHMPKVRRPNQDEDAAEYTLSESLFGQGTGSGSSADKRIGEEKKFFKEVIGDIEFQRAENNDPDNPAVLVNAKYIPPEKKATVKKNGGSSGDARGDKFSVPDEVFGINVKYHEVRKETWKDMYTLLGAYCEFKKTNGNKGLEIFNKEFVSGWVHTVDPRLIDKVSSNNFKISLNVIDQVFKIWVQTSTDSAQPTKMECSFDNAEQEMPEDAEPMENGEGDSCKGAEKAKKCRRNKWLYRLVDIIALDKVIDQAKDTYEAAMVKALTIDASTAEHVNQLFCNSLVSNQTSEMNHNQCNIGFWFDSMVGFNRQRWSDQLESTAKLAQSLGGSSNFRFQPNNSLSVAGGGFNAAGDAGGNSGGTE